MEPTTTTTSRDPEGRAAPTTPGTTAAPTAGRRPPGRAEVIGRGVTWLSRWSLRWLLVAGGVVVLWLLLEVLWPIVLPVLLALIVATVLEPPARLLHQRFGVPRGLAAGLSVLGLLGVLAGVTVLIAPSVGQQVVDVATSASEGLEKVEQWVLDQSRFDVTQEQVQEAVAAAQDRLQSSASSIASGVLVGVNAVTSALVTTAVTLVLVFFFVKDGHAFLPWLRRASGPTVGAHLSEVAVRSWRTLGGFIRTQALVGLIDGFLIGVGLLVVGVPLAVPLAVLTFFAAFAPIVGAITVGALAVLVALVSEGTVAALLVLAIVVAVQQLEGNVFLPWLQGRSLRLHAAVVLLAIILGSTLFGVAGAFLSVPAAAVAAVVIRYLDEQVVARSAAPPAATDGGEGGEGGAPTEEEVATDQRTGSARFDG